MPTLDATAKGASANSYGTRAEAVAYFDDRLNASTFTSASSDDQDRALIQATAHMEAVLSWNEATAGHRTTQTQRLSHPRIGMLTREWRDFYDEDVVAEIVKHAQFEQALFELAADRTGDPDARGLERVKAGSVEVEWDGLSSQQQHLVADIVFAMLEPWIENPRPGVAAMRSVELLRV